MYVVFRGGLGNQLFGIASALSFQHAASRSPSQRLGAVTSWYAGRQRDERFVEHRREFELGRLPGFEELAYRVPTPEAAAVYRSYQMAVRLPIRLPIIRLDGPEPPASGRRRVLIYEGMCMRLNSITHGIQRVRSAIERASIATPGKPADASADTVCIHVRRGDNVLPFNDSGGVPSAQYYVRAASRVSKPSSHFVVYSDDPTWCRQAFATTGWEIRDEPDPVEALMGMKQCDAFVLSNSTLGWWAAQLSEADPRRILAPRPFMPSWTDSGDSRIIPRDWIRGEAEYGLQP